MSPRASRHRSLPSSVASSSSRISSGCWQVDEPSQLSASVDAERRRWCSRSRDGSWMRGTPSCSPTSPRLAVVATSWRTCARPPGSSLPRRPRDPAARREAGAGSPSGGAGQCGAPGARRRWVRRHAGRSTRTARRRHQPRSPCHALGAGLVDAAADRSRLHGVAPRPGRCCRRRRGLCGDMPRRRRATTRGGTARGAVCHDRSRGGAGTPHRPRDPAHSSRRRPTRERHANHPARRTSR